MQIQLWLNIDLRDTFGVLVTAMWSRDAHIANI